MLAYFFPSLNNILCKIIDTAKIINPTICVVWTIPKNESILYTSSSVNNKIVASANIALSKIIIFLSQKPSITIEKDKIPKKAKINTSNFSYQSPVISGVKANNKGRIYIPFPIFQETNPVSIGGVFAIAAAAKAAKHTGGVRFESCDNQKIIKFYTGGFANLM